MANNTMVKAIGLVADALNLPVESLSETSALDNTDQWDSLGHMRIIMAMETAIGRSLNGTEIMNIASCRDIADLLG